MIDPSIALVDKLDDYLWTVCFYQEFQKSKGKISMV
jgi:hypothetical protein